MQRALVFALIALCACSTQPPRFPSRAERIVSLMPSFTEDLCALGARAQIAAVSKYSDDIPCAAKRPIVSDYASIDAEKIVALHADLAIGIPSQASLIGGLLRAGVPALLLPDDSFASLFSNLTRLGALTGHAREAAYLTASLRRHTAALVASERFKRRPSVFFVAQAAPLWTAGRDSYIGTLIVLAGGRNATGVAAPYVQYSGESLVARQPDVIVAGSDAGLAGVLSREPWRSLRAVREHRVYILRDAALLVRPGPRYNEGLSWLIDRLRPAAT